MSASTTSTVAFIYKRKYSDEKVASQTKRDHLLMEMANIRQGLGGEDFRYTLRHGNPQGISGDFATAQTGAASSKGVVFATTPALKYGVVTLDGPSMARAKGNDNAFYDLVTMESDGIMEEMGDSLAFDGYQDGNGIRGRRLSAATDVITLYDSEDVRNFKVGMTIGADDTATGASPRTGTTTVTAIDEDAGTVTLASAAAISSFADDDYMFRAGDPATCQDGLETLIPLTAATTIRGATVSTDARRLQGVRIDNTAVNPEENAGLLGVKIRQGGKRARIALWNPLTFWNVVRRHNAKVEFQGAGGQADYGFEYVMIHTPGGTIKAYSDPDVPSDRQWVGNLDSYQIRSIDKHIHVIRDDGRPSLRETSSDGIEIRLRSMAQPVITCPGEWGVASV